MLRTEQPPIPDINPDQFNQLIVTPLEDMRTLSAFALGDIELTSEVQDPNKMITPGSTDEGPSCTPGASCDNAQPY